MVQRQSSWNTLYDYESGIIYIHLKNNDLIRLNFSITGFENVKQDDIESLELKDSQAVDHLDSPPPNSTLFILDKQLYALTSKNDDGLDLCGDGQISIVKFGKNGWSDNEIDLDFSDTKDGSFYAFPTILTNPDVEDTIYVYGGICHKSGSISERMLSINFSSKIVSTIRTSTKPQPFYGASNIPAPYPQSQLVIGGQLNQGWLNMYQLATWDFNAGWSLKQIKSNDGSNTVNSRKFALSLPIFEPIVDESMIHNDFQLDKVLLIGGESNIGESNSAEPTFAKLALGTNNWYWDTNLTTKALNANEILGAASIFNTLVVINSTSLNSKKRDTEYKINLWDINSFEPVKSLMGNSQSVNSESDSDANKSSSDSSVDKTVVFATVFPIVFVSIIIGVLVTYLLKRRKRNKWSEEQAYNEIEFKFDDAHSTPFIIEPQQHYASDANSTLGNASINSWMKKRQEFEKFRNSYLASNETLSTDDDELLMGKKCGERVIDDEDDDGGVDHEMDIGSIRIPQAAVMNKSIKRLSKSYSCSNTSPVSPSHKRLNYLGSINSHKRHSMKLHSPEYSSLENSPSKIKDFDSSSDKASFDDQMDVQVLVSSKRRTILRVANPDPRSNSGLYEILEGSDVVLDDTSRKLHEESEEASLRQRIPSK